MLHLTVCPVFCSTYIKKKRSSPTPRGWVQFVFQKIMFGDKIQRWTFIHKAAEHEQVYTIQYCTFLSACLGFLSQSFNKYTFVLIRSVALFQN